MKKITKNQASSLGKGILNSFIDKKNIHILEEKQTDDGYYIKYVNKGAIPDSDGNFNNFDISEICLGGKVEIIEISNKPFIDLIQNETGKENDGLFPESWNKSPNILDRAYIDINALKKIQKNKQKCILCRGIISKKSINKS